MPRHCRCNSVSSSVPHCHHCCSSHIIAAVAVPLRHHHTFAVAILFAAQLPCHDCHRRIAATAIPSLFPLLQSPYHHCCCRMIVATVAVPSLSPSRRRCRSCCAIVATIVSPQLPYHRHCHHRSCHAIIVAIAVMLLQSPCHFCYHCVAITEFAMQLLQLPSHRLVIVIVVVM